VWFWDSFDTSLPVIRFELRLLSEQQEVVDASQERARLAARDEELFSNSFHLVKFQIRYSLIDNSICSLFTWLSPSECFVRLTF
jgi:hypothetical protein